MTRRRFASSAWGRAALPIACALLSPSFAASQPARDPAAAEALFREGLKALDANDWASACPKFAASMELDPSAGTSINVARCLEHDGKLAQAWAEYQRAKALARTATPQRRQEIEAFVDNQLAALEPRLPRLRIVLDAPPEGTKIERDGRAFPLGALGEEVPVDPGKHVVAAEAPGRTPFYRELEIAEGQRAEVRVELNTAPSAAPAKAAPPPVEPPREEVALPEPVGDRAEAPTSQRILSFVLMGTGAMGLGVGAVTGALAIGKMSDVEAVCDTASHTCTDASGVEAARDGRTLATVSTIGFVGGGVLGAAGIVLLLTAPRSNPEQASGTLVPSFGPSSFGARWEARW